MHPSHSIRVRTLSLSAVPLTFLVLLLALALFLEGRNAVLAAQSRSLAQALYTSDQAVELTDRAGRSVLNYDRTRNEADLLPYRSVMLQLPSTLYALEQLTGQDQRGELLARRLGRDLTAGLRVITTYLRYSQRRDKAAQTRLVNSPQVHALSAEITAAHAAFNERLRAVAGFREQHVRDQIAKSTAALIALCLLGIAVTIVLSLRFGLGITRRITRLADNARHLAQGEDAEHIGGNDEIAELDLVYRDMMRRTRREHDTVTVLQRALLPQALPEIAGVRLEAAYVPAFRGGEIGGDWYDVFPITDRLIGISVGDVAGHGLRAATIMGQARQALRTASYIESSPAAAVSDVNRVICRSESDVLITAFFATLDLCDGTMRYAIAGHPAPMFVKTGGSVESLRGGGFVFGVDSAAEYKTYEVTVEIGTAVVLFTDGVVEVNRDYFAGLKELRDAIEAEYRNASGNIAEAILGRIFRRTLPRDDAALLFIGVTALGASMRPARVVWQLDGTNERSARRVKRAVLWQLGEASAGGVDLHAAELVVNELIANVARHAPGPAELALEWRTDSAVLSVRDWGAPFAAPAENHLVDALCENGRGLYLVKSVAKEVRVEWTGAGNRVSAVLPLNGHLESAALRTS